MVQKATFIYSYSGSYSERDRVKHDSLEGALDHAKGVANGGVYVISMDMTVPRSDAPLDLPVAQFGDFELNELRDYIRRNLPDGSLVP